MAKLGMDVDAVRALAGQLDGQAQRLVSVIGSVDSLVRRAGNEWHGAHAVQFTNDWHNRFRPALQRAHDEIAGLATSARNNAAEQGKASDAGTAAGFRPTPVPHARTYYSTTDPASDQQYNMAESQARSAIAHYGKEFPGATAQLKEWADSLHRGTATAAQVEAMHRYTALITLAHMQRDTVHDAAQLAVDNAQDAVKSNADAGKSFAAMLAPPSGHSAAHDIVTGSGKDIVEGKLEDKIGGALLHGRPDQMVQAYDSTTDALLKQIGANASQSIGPLVHMDYSTAFDQNSILAGRLQEQSLYGIANDSTHMVTGDGSIPDTIGTNVISAVPEVGRVYDGLSGAMSTFHGDNAIGIAFRAADVANVQSVLGVQNAARSLQLVPAGQ